MNSFEKKVEIRWSDLDPNFHVLHSKYYDFGAYCRMAFLTENGLTPAMMTKHHFGPILFREECIFRKEIRFGDDVRIDFQMSKVSADFRKWTMVHRIYRDADTIAANITAEGAWMDTTDRKLTVPPAEIIQLFETAPRANNFEMK